MDFECPVHCKTETSRVFVIAALPDVTARCHSSCHVQEDGTARTVKELLQEHLQVRLRDLTIFPSVFFPVLEDHNIIVNKDSLFGGNADFEIQIYDPAVLPTFINPTTDTRQRCTRCLDEVCVKIE